MHIVAYLMLPLDTSVLHLMASRSVAKTFQILCRPPCRLSFDQVLCGGCADAAAAAADDIAGVGVGVDDAHDLGGVVCAGCCRSNRA